MDAYIYKAALLCEDDGERIRKRLAREGQAPEDPDDEHTYDSDDFPKGPYPDGGGESDSPQHCDMGARCINRWKPKGGVLVGAFLENPLTREGVRYVCESIQSADNAHSIGVTQMWKEFYEGDWPQIRKCRPKVALRKKFGVKVL